MSGCHGRVALQSQLRCAPKTPLGLREVLVRRSRNCHPIVGLREATSHPGSLDVATMIVSWLSCAIDNRASRMV